MNIQKARRQLIPLWLGALGRGSPQSTPRYLSIWALSAPPTPRTCGGRRADLHVHSATPTGAESSHVQKYLLVGPSVWGRKSQRGLAGAAEPGAASTLLKQWEPALIGWTQQDRGWLHSQEGQGKLSQLCSNWRTWRHQNNNRSRMKKERL